MLFVSDTFTDTNGTLLQNHTGELGATWAKYPGYTGDATIDANLLYGAGVNIFDVYYASGIPGVADYYVQATLIFKTSVVGAEWALIGRADQTVAAGNDTYYYANYAQNGGAWALSKIVSGTATSLGTFVQADGADHVGRLDMVGTTIKLIVDGTTQVTVTDSAITAAGRAGFYLLNTLGITLADYDLDSFSAVDKTAREEESFSMVTMYIW